MSALSVIKQLRATKYRGNLYEICKKLSAVLSQGEQPPDQELIKIFLARFPWEMVKEADRRQFSSWIEAKDFIEAKHRSRGKWAQEYYMEACEEYRKDMLRDREVQAHGWLDTENVERDKGRREVMNTAATRGDSRGRPASFRYPAERLNNRQSVEGTPQNPGRCFMCNGEGHRARQCPNANPATKKDGNRCRRCGGVGHWAMACPSPSMERSDRNRVKFEERNTSQGNGKA